MEFIRFVLSGFWTRAGFLILIVAAGNAVAEIIKAACPCRKIEAYRIGDRWHVQIEGARRGDIAETLKAAERDDETGGDRRFADSGPDRHDVFSRLHIRES